MRFIPETAGTINFIRNQSLGFVKVLGELIDNSFDASATAVSIEVIGSGKNVDIVVSDDGDGCADFGNMLTLGKHVRQRGTRLGRYGVGFKDAAIWIGGITQITSVKSGKKNTITIDWDRLVEWELPDPIPQPSAPGDRGTRITFHRIARRPPHGKEWDALVRDIGYLFTPAIKQGKQITLRRSAVPVIAPRFHLSPKLTDLVDVDASVDGKPIHIHVGIVPEGESNPRPGISYTHGFRVIIPASGLGCGENSCARVSGWVSLGDGWKLTKNKDDLSDHKEELGAAVYKAIQHVVKKAAGQALVLQSSELAAKLTNMLRGAWSDETDIKSTRDKGDKNGKIEPKRTDRKQRNARDAQPGDKTLRRMSAGKLRVEFVEHEPPSIGEVDAAGNAIRLAQNHPYIARLRREGNDDALLGVVVSMLVEHDRGQMLLPGIDEAGVERRFALGLGRVLNSISQPLLRAVDAA